MKGSRSDEVTEQTGDVWRRQKKEREERGGKEEEEKKQASERPRGKSSAKTDGNSAEQLMHSSVWLGQDLRDHETLVEEEAEREVGLRHCCHRHFAQFLTLRNVLALAYLAFLQQSITGPSNIRECQDLLNNWATRPLGVPQITNRISLPEFTTLSGRRRGK